MKNIISIFTLSLCLITGISTAQNITNTLGANGVFTIKDELTIYLSLSQVTGDLSIFRNFKIPANNGGDSQSGFVFKGYNRFIHTYFGSGTFGNNTFVGIDAGNFTMGGSGSQGSYNTGVGYQALNSNTTGNHNSAFGQESLSSNTTGYNNSCFGSYTLTYNTTGYDNSAFGYQSLLSNTTGQWNSALGYQSLKYNISGSSNSAFGIYSLISNTTGGWNSSFGSASLYYNTIGSENSAFGVGSLYNNTTGTSNCAFGHWSLHNNATGWNNTAVGHHSLEYSVGNYNTAIGFNAGSEVTLGENLTLIGIDANPSTSVASNQITLGNSYVSSLRCNVQTITSLSDKRDKKNITELTLGLDFISKLKPRQFNWDKREWYDDNKSDGSKMQETPTAGFIAQEFDEVQNSEHAEWLNLVLKDNPDKWEATYGNLLPVMVKAIQELKQENDELKSEIENLKSIDEQLAEIQNLKEELIEQVRLLKAKDEDQEVKFSSIENQGE